MFGTTPFFSEKDKRVRVLADGTVVSASLAQSEYARALNFIGDRFTATSNTIDGIKTYDIALKYADKIIPYEAGVAKGDTPGYLNFDGNHFDVSSLASGMYTVTSTGWVKVNSFTVKPLNIVNATGNEAVTAAEGASTINLTFNNDETDVYSNGTKVTAAPRALNFDSSFTITDDSTNDRVNIGGNFLTNPMGKKWGAIYGAQSDLSGSFGDGLFNTPYTSTEGDITGVNSSTHGHARRYSTSGSDDDTIEVVIPNLTQLAFNPHLYLKMSFATMDDSRFVLGFNSGSVPTGSNTFMTDLSAFALSYQYDTAETEDTVLNINRNDGAGAETKVSTTQSLTNTTPFTIELVGDATNNRWGWNYNGGAFTYYATSTNTVPALNTNLNFTFRMEQIASGPATIDFYYVWYTQDH